MIPRVIILKNSEAVDKFKKQISDLPLTYLAEAEIIYNVVDYLTDFDIAHKGLLDCMLAIKERYRDYLIPPLLKILTDAVVRLGFSLIDEIKQLSIHTPGTLLPYKYRGLVGGNMILVLINNKAKQAK